MAKRVEVLGVGVDPMTFEEALAQFESFLQEGGTHQVVTVNPEFVMRAQWDEPFRQVLNSADLALADGIGLVWATRLLGPRRPQGATLRERVAGSDLVPAIARRAAEMGWRLYFLGAAPEVAERAAHILKERYPGLQVAGTYAGSPAPEMEEAIVERIHAAHPDILFVAYGAPAQDLWITRNLNRLGVPVAMGVGGAFDFIAGRTRRAPRWVRRLGLEWLHRLSHEPWRWRRMLALPKFAWLVVVSLFRRDRK